MILPQVHLRNGENSCEECIMPEGKPDYILSSFMYEPVNI